MKERLLSLSVIRFLRWIIPVILFLALLAFFVVPEQQRLAVESGGAGSGTYAFTGK